MRGRVRREMIGDRGVDRQDNRAIGGFRLLHDADRGRGEILLGQRLADPTPWACRKVLAMPPPITSASTLVTRFSSRSILVETLAPPMIAMTGLVGEPSAFSSATSSACMVRPA